VARQVGTGAAAAPLELPVRPNVAVALGPSAPFQLALVTLTVVPPGPARSGLGRALAD